MGREKIEAERAAKLVELRKKYLARKGIISKAGTPNKVKLVGRDKVEAERRKKLEELREKYLAKKREVTKSIRPTARKTKHLLNHKHQKLLIIFLTFLFLPCDAFFVCFHN